jgi:hypothetical protein
MFYNALMMISSLMYVYSVSARKAEEKVFWLVIYVVALTASILTRLISS